MKQKLLDLLAKVKPYAMQAYAVSPFFCGLALGYLCQSEIRLCINGITTLVKWIMG